MPRVMSVAKTRLQFTDGVVYRCPDMDERAALQLGDVVYRWESVTDLIIRVWQDVTRRSSRVVVDESAFGRKRREWRPGWTFLKQGDVVALIEWSPRVGARWACTCGWQGTTLLCRGREEPPPEVHKHGAGFGHAVQYREPRRLGLREVVSVGEERLGDITPAEIAREGFPGMSVEGFVSVYCDGKPDPDRPVNRIEFREVAP